jgi:hypothetical protein
MFIFRFNVTRPYPKRVVESFSEGLVIFVVRITPDIEFDYDYRGVYTEPVEVLSTSTNSSFSIPSNDNHRQNPAKNPSHYIPSHNRYIFAQSELEGIRKAKNHDRSL